MNKTVFIINKWSIVFDCPRCDEVVEAFVFPQKTDGIWLCPYCNLAFRLRSNVELVLHKDCGLAVDGDRSSEKETLTCPKHGVVFTTEEEDEKQSS